MELSESLQEIISVKKASDETKEGRLELAFESPQLDFENLVGTITLRDKQLNLQDRCSVLFSKRQPVVLSPAELRFRPPSDQSENADERRVAKFILRFDEDIADQDKKIVSANPIQCYLDGRRLGLTFQKLGSTNVYRGQIELPKATLENAEGVLEWDLVGQSGKRFQLSTFFTIEN